MTGRAFALFAVALLAACTTDPDPVIVDDAGLDAGGDAGLDAGDGGLPVREETEPNDGAATDEVNTIAPGEVMHGVMQVAGDADVFRLASVPGRAYRVRVEVPSPSRVDSKLTVMDAGRDGAAAGKDYVRIVTAPAGGGAVLEFVAMGEGGHLVVVRQVHRDDEGSATHRYVLTVEELALDSLARRTLVFPSRFDDALEHGGTVRVYRFDVAQGTVVRLDLYGTTSVPQGLDGRIFVVAASTNDWIARNDDRAAGDANPLVDAPMTEGGTLYAIVEAVEPGASDMRYTLEATSR